ncbi:MAG TPA: GerMN domain-containing protein [Desulfuromonadales bacterium]|nr:GerMN domain-containing protein [Desulfuromonadales bacterium]
MLRIPLVGLLTLVVFLLLALSGCREGEVEQLADGLVVANQAYQEHFGPPPQGKKGRAFARVGYLPVRDADPKVQPFPLFLFTEENQLQLILDRLIGDQLHIGTGGEIYDPFPADLALVIDPLDQKTVTIRLTHAGAWPEKDRDAGDLALAETALQFPEVERVRILLNGEPLPKMPVGGYMHEAERIAELGSPQLILIAGAWEDDAEDPEELLIEFDRPVRVDNFALRHVGGPPVQGEYFTSIFEMAVVVHPEDPALFREGLPLEAEWQVEDALGRTGSGSATMALQRFEH